MSVFFEIALLVIAVFLIIVIYVISSCENSDASCLRTIGTIITMCIIVRPICVNGKWETNENLDGWYVGELEPHLFPEVTFENSPQQVELRLLGKLKNKPTKTNYILAEGDT